MARKKVESKVTESSGQTAMEQQVANRPPENKQEEMKLSLWDYRQEMAAIEAMVSETGEITEEQAAELIKLHAGSIDKMKCLVWIVNRADDAVEKIDAEIKRLRELKAYRQGFAQRISKALVDHILITEPERKKIDLDTYIIQAKKCPASVELVEGFHDPFLMRVPSIKNPSPKTIDEARANGDEIVYEPDKKAIKDVLVGGGTVEGATLIDNKHTLHIQ